MYYKGTIFTTSGDRYDFEKVDEKDIEELMENFKIAGPNQVFSIRCTEKNVYYFTKRNVCCINIEEEEQ